MTEAQKYAERDTEEQGQIYYDHMSHMTSEELYSKSDIAAELAHRDIRIYELEAKLEATWVSTKELSPDKSQHLLMVFYGGAVASCKYRAGQIGEPQQTVTAWRTDESGRFGLPLYWMPMSDPQ